MQIDRAEFLRYLGWKGQKTDETFRRNLEAAARRCLNVAAPRSVVRRFSLKDTLELDATGVFLEGADIRAHLRGCRAVYLFAATLGAGAERELARLSVKSSFDALLFDTACSCAVESYCDDVCADLQADCEQQLTARFSCGYGDFPLQAQRAICRLLRTDTAIGLCCDESLLLTPRKSVTAIVGITDLPRTVGATACPHGCEHCSARDCAYRKTE